MLGPAFGRTDFSRIFIFEPPDFFADFLAGFFLLIFVGKSAQKNPPGKSPGKSSKIYATKILQHISADCPGQKSVCVCVPVVVACESPTCSLQKHVRKKIWGNLFAFPLRKQKRISIPRFSFVIISQGPQPGGGFQTGGGLSRSQIWTRPSFFVPFGTFPIFSVFSRFVR